MTLKTFRMTATMETNLDFVFKAPADSDLNDLREHIKANIDGGDFIADPHGGSWDWGFIYPHSDEETENIITEEMLGA